MTTIINPIDRSSESFQAEVVQLGHNFQDRMVITMDQSVPLLKGNFLQAMQTTIRKTNDIFHFKKNGFEFRDFSDEPLGLALQAIAREPQEPNNPCEKDDGFKSIVEHTVAQWGQDIGFSFSHAICVDTVYRNTHNGKRGSVHFAHADFPHTEYPSVLKGHSEWKERVVATLGEMETEAYEQLDIRQMVNIWAPLDETLRAEPLALMDLQTLDSRDLRVYQTHRRGAGDYRGDLYPCLGVFPREEQRWYTKKTMRLGEVIIFDSCQTPHSAVAMPSQGDATRRSVECRILLV